MALLLLQHTSKRLPHPVPRPHTCACACAHQAWVEGCAGGDMGPMAELLHAEGRCPDLLFMALLVTKELAGAWREALSVFRWMQHQVRARGGSAGEHWGERL